MILDLIRNRVWVIEYGFRGGDELNLIERGENYGWFVVIYSCEYFGGFIFLEMFCFGLVDFKVIWIFFIVLFGLVFYNGDCFF